MGAGADQAGLGLHAPDRGQQFRSLRGILEPRVEIGHLPARPLYPDERLDLEARFDRFLFDLSGEVKVGGREPPAPPGGVPVLPLPDVALDDLFEPGVLQLAPEEPVVGRREARVARLYRQNPESRPRAPARN